MPTLHSKGTGRPPYGMETSLFMASTTHNAATAVKAMHARDNPMLPDAPERLTDIRLQQRDPTQALCQHGQELLPWRILAVRLPEYTLEEL
eukprot:5164707-Pleurochrysis_carterae.AAC.1